MGKSLHRRFYELFSFGCLLPPCAALAQTECATEGGPDLIIGDLTSARNYTGAAGIDVFGFGRASCNIGPIWLDFFDNNNHHPVWSQNLFKMHTVDGATRFEQLGQCWAMHGFFALIQDFCCTDCQATDGRHLGAHCTDFIVSAHSVQGPLGPKWQINAATGVFPYPPANPSWSGPVARRLQVRVSDLEPSSPTVLYFGEVQGIAADEDPDARFNNASYRRIGMTGSGDVWNAALEPGTVTQREQAGIRAWGDHDPAVVEHDVVVPNDGLLIVAGRATALASGQWHYEYAVQNLNSDRSARTFSIPLSACVTVTNIGFHDVDYHSGDGPGNVNFDGTDWTATVADGAITWATQTYAESISANALRWGTLYNFRFDADVVPAASGATATIGLFKPGTPTAITAAGVPAPAIRVGDTNGDGVVDLVDLAVVLANFGTIEGASPADGDFDGDGDVDLSDLALLLASFGFGCP